jgi:hypothetical protein
MQIKLNVMIGTDRRLVIDLPDNVPENSAATITIETSDVVSDAVLLNRVALLEAEGILVSSPVDLSEPDDPEPLSEDAYEAFLETLPPMNPGSEVLIREMRGNY